MKKFTSVLFAALACCAMSANAQDVQVTPAIDQETFEPSFKFSADNTYYGIYLDDETRAKNLTDDQYVYIGPDAENGRNLWIWDGSSTFVDANALPGNNSFDVPGNYMAFTVGTAGWSGLGYNFGEKAPAVDLSGIGDDYKFHMAVKSTSNETFYFYLVDGNGKTADIVLGDKAFPTDNGDKAPIANFQRDGEWYNIDIPMTYLEDQFGFSMKSAKAYTNNNIFCLLAGGTAGTVVNYDAVFFYGPKTSTAINGVLADDSKAPVEVFTTAGSRVSQDYANSHKGIYVVKQGSSVKKVATK